jgi:hypothetical protein
MAVSNIVRKTLLEADVFLDDGVLLRGSLYLANEEVAEDVVNHVDPFLLVKLEEGTRMVHKDIVAKIIIRGNAQRKLSPDMVPHENVSLMLRSGEAMEGTVLLKGFNRVSSQINSGAYFIPMLLPSGEVEYVRSDTIAQVVLIDESGNKTIDSEVLGSVSQLRSLA